MAALKLLDQLQRCTKILLLAVLAPGGEPCPIAAHGCGVTVHRQILLEQLDRGGLMRQRLVEPEQLL